MLQMLAIFAEMERSFIQERTIAGLASAKAQGRVGGRPKATDTKQARQAQALRDAGESVPDIARALGVSAATVYRITKTPQRPSVIPTADELFTPSEALQAQQNAASE